LAYDSVRGRLVLFGGHGAGCISGVDLEDEESIGVVWEWDGEVWHRIEPEDPEGDGNPTCRGAGGLTYMEKTGTSVLFGGSNGGCVTSTYFADTWEWDGRSWRLLAESGPSPRAYFTMTYDGDRGVVVLGAHDDEAPDNWEWDGETWTRVAEEGPGAGEFGLLAFHSECGETVALHGNLHNCDTSLWGGELWQELRPDSPPGLIYPAGTYAPDLNGVLVYGGRQTNGHDYGFTWLWDGVSWTELEDDDHAGTTSPHSSDQVAMVWDDARHRAVLYDGQTSLVWEWSGDEWHKIEATDPENDGNPEMRRGPKMAYDAARQETVLYGGHECPSTSSYWLCPNETWVWNGASWRLAATDGPVVTNGDPQYARRLHAMAYDAVQEAVVMMGGLQESGSYDGKLWRWNGSSWASQNSNSSPNFHAMSYDADAGRPLMLTSAWNPTFTQYVAWLKEWRGSSWVNLTYGSIPERDMPVMDYDAEREKLVVALGGDPNSYMSDVWEWERNADGRPAHIVSFSFAAAGYDRMPAVTDVSLRAVAGGTGFPDGDPTHGARMQLWDRSRWTDVGQANLATPEQPDEVTWSSADAVQMQRLFIGPEQFLRFAVIPAAPNGQGDSYGTVATDYVEVRVRYRLPMSEESYCADGLDDDADGLADCADEDCLGVSGCEYAEEVSCADGNDNDGDGDTDCDDRDCWCDAACGLAEAGCCFFLVRTWCDNGELLTEDCYDDSLPQSTCGWSDASQSFVCGGIDEAPSFFDYACPGNCVPDCDDRECGGDGCSGLCGYCEAGETCNGGICQQLND